MAALYASEEEHKGRSDLEAVSPSLRSIRNSSTTRNPNRNWKLNVSQIGSNVKRTKPSYADGFEELVRFSGGNPS